MLADEVDFVLGVDTHRDTHALAVVAAATGAVVVIEPALPARPAGYRRLLRLAERHAPGRRAFVIEGSGSYGAGLARFLQGRGQRVHELERPRRGRRPRGKSDALDAVATARALLGEERLASPRSGGRRAQLQALLAAREGAVAARRAALCQLRGLLVSAPEGLREELRSLSRARLVSRCARLRPRASDAERGTRLALRLVARRIQLLCAEERRLSRELAELVDELAPELLAEPGLGPVTAAQLLACWSHRGRLHSEAAFARLAGVAPIPASSGRIVRQRLDRGGDRRLNRALHTIVLSRRRHHPPTIAYVERRLAEGKSLREAVRCLKRYLARSLFRRLEAMPLAA